MKKIFVCLTFCLLIVLYNKAQAQMAGCMGSYNYHDVWMGEDGTVYANAGTSPYCSSGTNFGQPFYHHSGAAITLTSPGGRTSSQDGGSYSGASASLGFDENDVGQFIASDQHKNSCNLTGSYAGASDTLSLRTGYTERWYKTDAPNDQNTVCTYKSQCSGNTLNCGDNVDYPNSCKKTFIKLVIPYDYSLAGARRCRTPYPPIYADNFYGSCSDHEGVP